MARRRGEKERVVVSKVFVKAKINRDKQQGGVCQPHTVARVMVVPAACVTYLFTPSTSLKHGNFYNKT